MQIIQYPHPTLRHKSKPIQKVDARAKASSVAQATDASSSQEDVSQQEARGPMTHKEADRLDAMMNMVLCYISSICAPNGGMH